MEVVLFIGTLVIDDNRIELWRIGVVVNIIDLITLKHISESKHVAMTLLVEVAKIAHTTGLGIRIDAETLHGSTNRQCSANLTIKEGCNKRITIGRNQNHRCIAEGIVVDVANL